MASQTVAKARVAHQVPGRMRLRFEKGAGLPETSQRLEESLTSLEGVHRVEIRQASRSVVVHYNPAVLELQRLVEEGFSAAAVEILEDGIEIVERTAKETRVGRGIVKAVGTVNTTINTSTGGALDLRDAFPLTLLGLGLRRVVQGNLQPVPWYNLLYYGYSTFVALHGRRGSGAARPDAAEILRRRYARGEISSVQLREMISVLDGSAATPAELPEPSGQTGEMIQPPPAAATVGEEQPPEKPRRPRRQKG